MKKSLFILGSFVLVVSTILMVILRHQHLRDLNEILKDGRLTVLINSVEYGFTKDSIKLAGFQYEVIKKYADELGVELVVLHEPDHEKGTKELLKGDCDVVVSLQPVVSDSSLKLVSLNPLIETNLMLVQRPDSASNLPVRKHYDLDGKTITVTKASPFVSIVHSLSEDLAIEPVLVESSFSNIDTLISQVAAGNISFAVCPGHLTQRMIKKYPVVDMSLPLTFHLPLAWTVRKHSVLLQKSLNDFIDRFSGTADYWVLYTTYFVNR